ncbi:MAG: aldo/keto reductase [Chloroflexi bacterium]|nr:aldo/keto reductase [Chloroflexota bacterium]
MDQRVLGRTGLSVSALGLGGGAVGGLMVRGSAADQERALGVAFDAGITFIDTAPSYGDGASETNLGRALGRVAAGRANVVLATKFTIPSGPDRDLGSVIEESLDASLRRLGRERVDLLQLHNAIGSDAAVPGRSLEPARVIEAVAPGLERLRTAGKIGCYGITAIGDHEALNAVIDSGRFQTAQVPFNLLAPTADGVLPRAAASGMGTIGIRVLAGGALSGSDWRHPIGMAQVAPIGTGATYAEDVAAAGRFRGLVDGGWARSLAEAALRFAAFSPDASTVLVGVSTVEQLQDAIAATERGPLPSEAMALIENVWRG